MRYELRDRALDLVRNRPPSMTLENIAQATGINHNWLKKFSADLITEPGVNRVWTVYCFLSGKQHEL